MKPFTKKNRTRRRSSRRNRHNGQFTEAMPRREEGGVNSLRECMERLGVDLPDLQEALTRALADHWETHGELSLPVKLAAPVKHAFVPDESYQIKITG